VFQLSSKGITLMTTNKVFFAGLATVAFAATTLLNVASTKAAEVVTSVGISGAAGSTGLPKFAGGASTTTTISPFGSASQSFSNADASPIAAAAGTRTDGLTGTGLRSGGASAAQISVTPILTTAGAGAFANTNGAGGTGSGTAAGATQLGSFGAGAAGAGFGAFGAR
jgi:hypothetical protein